MKLFLSFRARENGNCAKIAHFLMGEKDKYLAFKDRNVTGCSNCDYQCFKAECKNRGDGVYELFDSFGEYDKIILIVPMYCGNPSSLYFSFNERSQDYFMRNEEMYEKLLPKLYLIGVYGSAKETPHFISILNQWFSCSQIKNHVLGIERRKYQQKMRDYVTDVPEVRESLKKFLL